FCVIGINWPKVCFRKRCFNPVSALETGFFAVARSLSAAGSTRAAAALVEDIVARLGRLVRPFDLLDAILPLLDAFGALLAFGRLPPSFFSIAAIVVIIAQEQLALGCQN